MANLRGIQERLEAIERRLKPKQRRTLYIRWMEPGETQEEVLGRIKAGGHHIAPHELEGCKIEWIKRTIIDPTPGVILPAPTADNHVSHGE